MRPAIATETRNRFMDAPPDLPAVYDEYLPGHASFHSQRSGTMRSDVEPRPQTLCPRLQLDDVALRVGHVTPGHVTPRGRERDDVANCAAAVDQHLGARISNRIDRKRDMREAGPIGHRRFAVGQL